MQEETVRILKTSDGKNEKKAYLRPKDGPLQYGMSRPKFVEVAKKAGAYYKVDSIDSLIKDTAEKLSTDKGKKEPKAEIKKPSIKDRMASGEAKKKANEAKKAAEPKLPKAKAAEIA